MNRRTALKMGAGLGMAGGIGLLGAYELLHRLETPYRVVINEAVELAKAYGGTDGHKYVNGVLDRLASELRAVEVKANHPSR